MRRFSTRTRASVEDLTERSLAQIPSTLSIVAELRQLRAASQLSRYRGAAPRLPSREAISDIVGSLISALYPRHFGPPGLDARDADAFVARTLAEALPALKHEIELALALEQEDARDAAEREPSIRG